MTNYSETITGTVVSALANSHKEINEEPQFTIVAELDGFVGDKYRSHMRGAYEGESLPVGTIRRNDRQWSAVSLEELTKIQEKMQLKTPLAAEILTANLCLEGIPNFSQLPKGTQLWFPSGAVLVVEDYNAPCRHMAEKVAKTYTTLSSEPLSNLAFAKAAKKLRGLVGVIDVAGEINKGDEVIIKIYNPKRLSNFLEK
jgi:hypothetical protein